MKLRLLFLGFFLLCVNVSGEEKETKELREMRAAGHIIVFDSVKQPVEIQMESKGKTIVCYSQEHNDSQYFTVRDEMFQRGQFSTLVKCIKGELSFDPGFI